MLIGQSFPFHNYYQQTKIMTICISTRLIFQPPPHLMVYEVSTKITMMLFDIGIMLTLLLKIIYTIGLIKSKEWKEKPLEICLGARLSAALLPSATTTSLKSLIATFSRNHSKVKIDTNEKMDFKLLPWKKMNLIIRDGQGFPEKKMWICQSNSIWYIIDEDRRQFHITWK